MYRHLPYRLSEVAAPRSHVFFEGLSSMDTPTGIGRPNGNRLTGLAIMAMAKVWLTCLPVAPLSTRGVVFADAV